MPRFLKLIKVIAIVVTFCVTSSCSDDDDNVINPPITQHALELAKSDPNLAIFVAALEKADLADILQSEGTYTILAPNDEAFNLLYTTLNVTTLDDIDTALLKTVLSYHIIPNIKRSTASLSSGIGSGYLNTLATGTASTPITMYYDATSGAKFNDIAAVIGDGEDQEVTNGILHEIDAVLLIPTLLELITANTNLSDLVAALNREDQAATLAVLNDPSNTPITIFGPSNTAFSALLNDMDDPEVTSVTNIDATLLSEALAYHVIPMSNSTSDNIIDGTITTLGGEVSTTQSPATLTDANGTIATLTTTDVQGADGVLHIIDAVLLPKD